MAYPTVKVFGYTTFSPYQEPLPPLVPDDYGVKKSWDKKKLLVIFGIVSFITLFGTIFCLYENTLNINNDDSCYYLLTNNQKNNLTLFYYVINNDIYCPDYCHSNHSLTAITCPENNSTCSISYKLIHYCNKQAIYDIHRFYSIFAIIFLILFVISIVIELWILCLYIVNVNDDEIINVYI